MSEAQFGRRPVQVVELRQPRCALRFGTAPCTATTADGPRCYNTRTTCLDPENFDTTGAFLTWRFVSPDSFVPDLYQRDGEHIRTNAIPMLARVRTQPTRLNIAAARDGESPFGVRATIDVDLQDIPWDDHVGDFYRDQRADPTRGTFWGKWKARNAFTAQMTLTFYEGYEGQALGDMQSRLFVLERVDGPDASGRVRLHGVDPLQLADRRRALFPRASDILLRADIAANASDIQVAAPEADLTDEFGNVGRFVRFGDEIIRYTGQTLVDPERGVYNLTGVERGALGTEAAQHDEGEAGQRVGRYEGEPVWRVAYDLLTEHTQVTDCTGCPASADFIDLAAWDAEGDTYLATSSVTGTVTEPTPVTDLIGELSQQGAFFIWWDERERKIPLLAIRPQPGAVPRLTDRDNLLPGSVLKDDPNARFTRVLVYYAQRGPLRDGDDPGNYARGLLRARPDREGPEFGGEVRTQRVFSRWIRTAGMASLAAGRLLVRYRDVPRYLSFRTDAKDRALSVGDVIEVETRTTVDSEGAPVPGLWQIISAEEIEPGHTMAYEAETFPFDGKFARYMADTAPDHGAATEGQKEIGGWYAADSGKLGDGSPGYQYW